MGTNNEQGADMRAITFTPIKGTKIRRNRETGVEIINEGPDGYAVIVPRRDGNRMPLSYDTLGEARAAATLEVEWLRTLIAEAYTEAMAEPVPVAEPVMVVEDNRSGLV